MSEIQMTEEDKIKYDELVKNLINLKQEIEEKCRSKSMPYHLIDKAIKSNPDVVKFEEDIAKFVATTTVRKMTIENEKTSKVPKPIDFLPLSMTEGSISILGNKINEICCYLAEKEESIATDATKEESTLESIFCALIHESIRYQEKIEIFTKRIDKLRENNPDMVYSSDSEMEKAMMKDLENVHVINNISLQTFKKKLKVLLDN